MRTFGGFMAPGLDRKGVQIIGWPLRQGRLGYFIHLKPKVSFPEVIGELNSLCFGWGKS